MVKDRKDWHSRTTKEKNVDRKQMFILYNEGKTPNDICNILDLPVRTIPISYIEKKLNKKICPTCGCIITKDTRKRHFFKDDSSKNIMADCDKCDELKIKLEQYNVDYNFYTKTHDCRSPKEIDFDEDLTELLKMGTPIWMIKWLFNETEIWDTKITSSIENINNVDISIFYKEDLSFSNYGLKQIETIHKNNIKRHETELNSIPDTKFVEIYKYIIRNPITENKIVEKDIQLTIEENIANSMDLFPIDLEYRTDKGRIDILCIDKDNHLVIIECKCEKASYGAIGQLLSYRTYLNNNKEIVQKDINKRFNFKRDIDWSLIRLIVIGGEISDQIIDAAITINEITSVRIELIKYNILDNRSSFVLEIVPIIYSNKAENRKLTLLRS